jgi:hypothetical protein
VLITAGAAGALFLVGLLCGDGEILVGRPCFPPAFDALRGLGTPVVTVQSRFDDGYRIDLAAFAARLSPRTRLVMFASPQNPAGVTITEGEVDQMLAARFHGPHRDRRGRPAAGRGGRDGCGGGLSHGVRLQPGRRVQRPAVRRKPNQPLPAAIRDRTMKITIYSWSIRNLLILPSPLLTLPQRQK